MREWERKYEEYKSGKLDEKISELQEKVNDKSCTKDEYKEYEKLSKIKQNIPKIENVLEYRNKVKSLLKEVDKELIRRQDLKEADKQKEELEAALKKLEEKQEELEKELKNKTLSEKEINTKKEEIKQLRKEKDKNNLKFFENEKFLNENLGYKSEFSSKSDKELESLALKLSTRISKCNIAARNMVEGKSWDTIEKKLEGFKERTTYKPTNRKLSEMVKTDEDKTVSPNFSKISEKVKKIMEENANEGLDLDISKEELDLDISKEELDLDISKEEVEEEKKSFVTKFLDKHPKIKGMVNRIKAIFNKESALPEGKLPEGRPVEEEPKKEEPVTEEELGLREDFMKQLKIIADKGVDEERKLREGAGKEKLAKWREDNGYRTGDTGAEHGTNGKLGENDKSAQEKIDGGFEIID